jgi:hypothetical protein
MAAWLDLETIINTILVHHWRKAGEVIVFDDTYPHSAWNDSDSERIILYIDFKVPEVRRGCFSILLTPSSACARLVFVRYLWPRSPSAVVVLPWNRAGGCAQAAAAELERVRV